MKYKWLNKKNNDKLIIFFNGWGMDENIVSHLECEDFDVLEFHDYNDLHTDIILPSYKEKYIVGWSMGVMIAGQSNLKNIINNYTSAVAICGTPYPINNDFGIPERIYNLTVRGFNETSSEKFIERMGLNPNDIKTTRSFESKKSELKKLLEYRFDSDLKYTKTIIPNNDLIIPTNNQKKFWEGQTNIKTEHIDSGHYPFSLYTKWMEIIC